MYKALHTQSDNVYEETTAVLRATLLLIVKHMLIAFFIFVDDHLLIRNKLLSLGLGFSLNR